MNRIEKNENSNEIIITGRVTVAELYDWLFENFELDEYEDFVLTFASDKIFINVSQDEKTSIA